MEIEAEDSATALDAAYEMVDDEEGDYETESLGTYDSNVEEIES